MQPTRPRIGQGCRTILCTLVLGATLIIATCSAVADNADRTSSSRIDPDDIVLDWKPVSRKTYRLYLLLERSDDALLSGFTTYLKSRHVKHITTVRALGTVPPPPASNAIDSEQAVPAFIPMSNSLLDDIKAAEPDIIVTIGTLPTVAVHELLKTADATSHLAQTPIVFAKVPSLERIDFGNPDDNIWRENVSGLVFRNFNLLQMQVAKAIVHFQRVAIAYDACLSSGDSFFRDLLDVSESLDFTIIPAPVDFGCVAPGLGKAVARVTSTIIDQHADLLFIHPDDANKPWAAPLVDAAVENGIPSFSNNPTLVMRGNALFSYVHQAEQMGRAIAHMAILRLMTHGPMPLISINAIIQPILYFNPRIAAKFRIPVPQQTVYSVRVIDTPSKILKSSRDVY